MVEKNLEKSKSKHVNAFAILKLWEEELKIKNEVNKDKVNSREKNDSPEIKCQNKIN